MTFRLASVLSSPGLILPENTSKHSPKEDLPVSQSLQVVIKHYSSTWYTQVMQL